jgi:arabinofuranosyltransferase
VQKNKTILIYLVLILLGIHLIYYSGWTHDDPFITFRYADNAADGKGLVFNEGERVEGYSNFLFLVMLIPGAWLGIGLLFMSKLYGFFFALAALMLLIRFLLQYYPEFRWQYLTAALLFSLNGALSFWAVSGMETALSLFFVTAAWIFFNKEARNGMKAFPWSSLFLVGASLNRPEGAIYFIALLFLLLMLWKKHRLAPKNIISWFLWFVIPFGLYNLWRIYYFGSVFPNTFYAKATGGFFSQAEEGILYLVGFIRQHPYLILFVLSLPVFIWKEERIERWSALCLVFAQTGFVVVCGGDWMPLSRFFVPVLAPLFFLFQEMILEFMERLKPVDPNFRLRDALGLACAALIFFSLVQERRITRPIVYSVKTQTLFKPHMAVGEWFRENVPPQSLLAGEEAGIIPYYSGLRFLDLLGIVDAHIARQEGAMHQKYDVDYVLSRNPDYVLLYTLNPVNGKEPLKARMQSGDVLMNSPRFREIYRPVKSFPHGNDLLGRDYLTLFIRNAAALPADINNP